MVASSTIISIPTQSTTSAMRRARSSPPAALTPSPTVLLIAFRLRTCTMDVERYQMYGGRRTSVGVVIRDTLGPSFMGQRGFSMDQPMLSLAETRSSFRHQALLYDGEDEFLAATSAFVREGL